MLKKNRKTRGRDKGCEKSGGRKKGSLNRRTIMVRELFGEHGFDFVDEVVRSFNDLESKERVTLALVKIPLLTKLAPFFMPKLKAESEKIENRNDGGEDDERVTTEDLLKVAGKT